MALTATADVVPTTARATAALGDTTDAMALARARSFCDPRRGGEASAVLCSWPGQRGAGLLATERRLHHGGLRTHIVVGGIIAVHPSRSATSPREVDFATRIIRTLCQVFGVWVDPGEFSTQQVWLSTNGIPHVPPRKRYCYLGTLAENSTTLL